jgi:hypothetical protein
VILMKGMNITIKLICLVVALAAAECALFAPGPGDVYFGVLLNTVALPMMSILLFVSRRQRRLGQRGGDAPRLTGFQFAGAASLATVVAALVFVPWVYGALIRTFDPVRQIVLRMLGFRAETYTTRNIAVHWCAELSLYVSISSFLTITMLLIASIGGWLGSRGGTAAERTAHGPMHGGNIPTG